MKALLALAVLLVSVPNAFAEKKEWAILTFLNGFNSLDHFGYLDMNEMEKIGSSGRVHVVSQWASMKTKTVTRVYVGKDSDPANVTSPVVENLGRVDMGDYRTLVDFVKWAAKKYPAEKYFINIWNHGNGWHFSKNRSGGVSTRDVSYDDLSGNKITTEQLGVAMAEISRELGQKVDILASDSCLMAMAEVVGQVKGSVDHFVASEEVEPADGWPYDALLEKWNAGGKKSAADVSKILTDVYVAYYGKDRAVTLSGMNVAKYPELAMAVRDLSESIKTLPTAQRQKVLQAVVKTVSYTNDDYKDLGDLIDQISADRSISVRAEILARVKATLRSFVIANGTSPAMARSQGVAVWFPDAAWQFDSYRVRYDGLAFNQDTAWIDAISSTLKSSGQL